MLLTCTPFTLLSYGIGDAVITKRCQVVKG